MGELDAAWEALWREMYGDVKQTARVIAHYRPIIEDAIRSEGAAEPSRDALAGVYEDGIDSGYEQAVSVGGAAVAESLDDAWKAAEAALPEGWTGPVVRRSYDFPDTYWALAEEVQGDSFREGYGDSPAAALRALAARLSALQVSE